MFASDDAVHFIIFTLGHDVVNYELRSLQQPGEDGRGEIDTCLQKELIGSSHTSDRERRLSPHLSRQPRAWSPFPQETSHAAQTHRVTYDLAMIRVYHFTTPSPCKTPTNQPTNQAPHRVSTIVTFLVIYSGSAKRRCMAPTKASTLYVVRATSSDGDVAGCDRMVSCACACRQPKLSMINKLMTIEHDDDDGGNSFTSYASQYIQINVFLGSTILISSDPGRL